MEEDTKIKEFFEKDIDNMVEHINLVIEAHNKLVDKYAELQQKINKAIEYLKTTERITNNPLNTEDNFDRLWINGHEDKIENIDNLINILKGEEK